MRACQSDTERRRVIRLWNDPTSEFNVFVTSMRLAYLGLDIHRACHSGIVLQCPWNVPTLNQVLGLGTAITADVHDNSRQFIESLPWQNTGQFDELKSGGLQLRLRATA